MAFPESQRLYKECIRKLNKLQPPPGVIQANRTNPDRLQGNVAKMENFLSRLGLTLSDVDNLRVIHVTGTKGKGTTCAFVESILRHHGFKTGLLSSPYMTEVRERIRINGRPIDKDLFNDCFRKIDQQLERTKEGEPSKEKIQNLKKTLACQQMIYPRVQNKADNIVKEANDNCMPGYIAFLTILGLYVFHHEHVDVVILEEGYSGVNDNTNVVRQPVVCGISSFHEDHVTPGGQSFEELVYNKAGILKDGVPAISVPQTECVMEVLRRRSEEKKCKLYIAPPMTPEQLADNNLGLAGDVQFVNAGLAVQLCKFWLECYSTGKENVELAELGFPHLARVTLTEEIIAGLTSCRWNTCPQIISKRGITYYLDGANTRKSLQNCVRWFTEQADQERAKIQGENGKVCRALVFNFVRNHPVDNYLNWFLGLEFDLAAFCPALISTNPREIPVGGYMNMLPRMQTTCLYHVIYRPIASVKSDVNHDDFTVDPEVEYQRAVTQQEAWSLLPQEQSHSEVFRSLALALGRIRERFTDATHIQVLVTGNPLLIASALQLLDPFMNF